MTSKEKEKNIEDPTPAAMADGVEEASKMGERLGNSSKGRVICNHIGDSVLFMRSCCRCVFVFVLIPACLLSRTSVGSGNGNLIDELRRRNSEQNIHFELDLDDYLAE